MSKTTDEMILDLLTRGFTLPDDMVRTDGHWCMRCKDGVCRTMPAAFAHAIIAMHFAAEQLERGWGNKQFGPCYRAFDEAMIYGNAEGAIRALWEANQ
jgi:hypothetical protein